MPGSRPEDDQSIYRRKFEPRSGFRGAGTGARAGFAHRVEPFGKPAALAGGGVLVQRALGDGLVQTRSDGAKLGLGLVQIATGGGDGESLQLDLDQFLACAIARPQLDVLAYAFLSR